MTETEPDSFAQARAALIEHTRYVQDFPEEGVLFEDLTPVLANAEAFAAVVDAQAEAAKNLGAEVIGGLYARGFLLGSAVAYKLGLGVIAIRKRGKLPHLWSPRSMNLNMALQHLSCHPRVWILQVRRSC